MTELFQFINKFLKNELNELEKFILLLGIKGTGKSTLLLQNLNFEKFSSQIDPPDIYDRVYIDFSKLKNERFTLHLSLYHPPRRITLSLLLICEIRVK